LSTLEEIFHKISETKRLPLLFVGSGISKRYTTNDFSWKELLIRCISEYEEDAVKKFRWYNQKSLELIDSEEQEHLIYQHIGAMIERDFNLAYFEGKITFGEVSETESPLKVFICQLLSNPELKVDVKEELEHFKKLKEKMLTVITTNYDTLLESIFTNHDPIVGQKVFMGSEMATILKIHGSITDPNSLILTKKDYDKFEKKSKILAAKVLNLFTENPVFFLGYSITDDNVRRLLYNIYTCIDSDIDFRSLTERLIFIRYDGNVTEPIIGTHSLRIDGTDIRMTEITLSDYTPLFEQMNSLRRITELKEILRLKELIHEIVIDYDGEKKKIVNLTPEEDYQGDEVVVAIGKFNAVSDMVGARGLTADEIFRDVVYDDVIKIPLEWLVKETLPSLIKGNPKLPIHKYIQDPSMISSEKLLEIYADEEDSFITTAMAKVIEGYVQKKFKSLEDIYNSNEPFTNMLHYLVIRATYDADHKEIEDFLKKHYDSFPDRTPASTIRRKLVLIYDKKKNKKIVKV
jgi:SIR2-like domain